MDAREGREGEGEKKKTKKTSSCRRHSCVVIRTRGGPQLVTEPAALLPPTSRFLGGERRGRWAARLRAVISCVIRPDGVCSRTSRQRLRSRGGEASRATLTKNIHHAAATPSGVEWGGAVQLPSGGKLASACLEKSLKVAKSPSATQYVMCVS